MKHFFIKMNIAEGDRVPTGCVLRDDVFVSIGRFFPLKSKQKLDELRRAILKAYPDQQILNIEELMKCGNECEGSGDRLCNVVRRQHLDEVKHMCKGLITMLRGAAFAGTGKCLVVDVVKVLKKMDTNISHTRIFEYLARGLACNIEEVNARIFSDLPDDGSSTRFLRIDAFISNIFKSPVKPSLNFNPDAAPVTYVPKAAPVDVPKEGEPSLQTAAAVKVAVVSIGEEGIAKEYTHCTEI